MKNMVEALNESLSRVNEAHFSKEVEALYKKITTKGNKKCQIKYETYERYGGGRRATANFKASDLWEVCFVILHNLNMYLDAEDMVSEESMMLVDDTDAKERADKGEDIFNRIMESSGDGCDYISYLKVGNEVLVDDGDFDEEENW